MCVTCDIILHQMRRVLFQKQSGLILNEAPYGVYILSTTGRLFKDQEWDTGQNDKAVGVLVKNEKVQFVIAPEEKKGIDWSDYSYSSPVTGCTITTDVDTAKQDYLGLENTNAIVKLMGDGRKEYAAKYCVNYIFKNGKQGYLPSLGELYEAYLLISDIQSHMDAIGGTPLVDSSSYIKLSSTQNNAYNAWRVSFADGNIRITSKYTPSTTPVGCARPFCSV